MILALVFNGTVSAVAASWSTNQALQDAPADAMMICTGSAFKWISQQAFMELGEVVFIDPPTDIDGETHQVDCSYSHLSDHYTDTPSVAKLVDQTIAYKAMATKLAKRPYTSYPYQTAQSRAPPLL